MPRSWTMLATGDRLRREWWQWGWEDGLRGLPPQRLPDTMPCGLVSAYADGYAAGEEHRSLPAAPKNWQLDNS